MPSEGDDAHRDGQGVWRGQAAGAQEAVPATVLAARQAPLTIPSPVARIIGRSTELAELRGLLAEQRLVTLTGVGGCGKTRLAIALATEVAREFPDGARLVELAPVAEGAMVATTVAAALGVTEDPTATTVEALSRHLRSRRYLLVLDNCEHVVGACAALVEALLRSCPGLQVLSTSREALGVPGEVTFPVPLLDVPPRSPTSGLDEVRRYPAVQLLLERAAASTVRDLTDADAGALATVCASLDGLPLAIELAAARTSVLTMTEIAERLHDPAVLRVRRYANHPHQQALDASIGWSYDLLDAPARALFRQLAVFTGGFTLPAAEAIRPPSGDRPAREVLAELVAKSLVVPEWHPPGARYRLLETIRRWAADRLTEHPDEDRSARARHAEHFLAVAEEANHWLRGPDVGQWLQRLAAEHENMRAALAWCSQSPDPMPQLRLAVALSPYCRLSGRYSEGRDWLRQALSRQPDSPQETVGRALGAVALFAFLVSDYAEAQAHAERALTIHRACGDHVEAAKTLRLLGSMARERGEYHQSLAHFSEALATSGSDGSTVADVLQMTGFTAWLSGDLDRAEHLLRDALHKYQRTHDTENIASTSLHLAAVAHYRGRPDMAGKFAADALATFRQLQVKEGIAWALNLLGLVELGLGDTEKATVLLRESLEVHVAVGDRWRQASVLEALAATFLARSEPGRAAQLISLAATLRESIGVPVPAIEVTALQQTAAALRDRLPEADRTAALARGAATAVPDILTHLASLNPAI